MVRGWGGVGVGVLWGEAGCWWVAGRESLRLPGPCPACPDYCTVLLCPALLLGPRNNIVSENSLGTVCAHAGPLFRSTLIIYFAHVRNSGAQYPAAIGWLALESGMVQHWCEFALQEPVSQAQAM